MKPDLVLVRNDARPAQAAEQVAADASAPMQGLVHLHKLSRRLRDLRCRRLSRLIEHLIRVVCAARIPAEADIHPSVHFSHNALGVVITKKSRIGAGCQIGMHVLLGSAWPREGGPHLEEDVVVMSGAKVLGPVRIGRGSVIGANAVVLKDVPPHALVVGVPGVVKKTGIRVEDYRIPVGLD